VVAVEALQFGCPAWVFWACTRRGHQAGRYFSSGARRSGGWPAIGAGSGP